MGHPVREERCGWEQGARWGVHEGVEVAGLEGHVSRSAVFLRHLEVSDGRRAGWMYVRAASFT
jgi:hypothetical protein